jgi:EAL domain-containing protein (putative c-di-GMP-specific phosphodiesterase class I)
MTPAEYRTRCRIAESCLPPAEYRTLLTRLHDDMLGVIEAATDFEAIAADQAMTIELDKVLMRQALEALKELQYAATTDKAFAMADAAIDALKERLK